MKMKMSKYDFFSLYYDDLTKNVNYTGMADYLLNVLERLNHSAGITLDLACGTGSLCIELFKRGIDIYGVDYSIDMLSAAKDKVREEGLDILFLCQDMQKLDLFGTVNTVFCCLDSINHLKSKAGIKKAFERVSLFLEKDGYFIFDVNTPYKHKNILGFNTFVYDMKNVYCVWQNSYREADNRVDISLDFFEENDGLYRRSSERFFEISVELSEIKKMLEDANLIVVATYDDFSFNPVTEKSERVTFVARKA